VTNSRRKDDAQHRLEQVLISNPVSQVRVGHRARRRALVISPDPRQGEILVRALHVGGFLAHAVRGLGNGWTGEAHLFVVDLTSNGVESIELVQQLAREGRAAPIVAIGPRDDDARIIAAIHAGAHGCLYADDARDGIGRAAAEALQGGHPMSRGMAHLFLRHVRHSARWTPAERGSLRPLTERERVVLRQMATGQSYEDVGRALGVSVNTVRTYVRSVYKKLDVNSRTEAVIVGTELGIVASATYSSGPVRR
jgi:DNA-binding NarL/FixJ family response regulator